MASSTLFFYLVLVRIICFYNFILFYDTFKLGTVFNCLAVYFCIVFFFFRLLKLFCYSHVFPLFIAVGCCFLVTTYMFEQEKKLLFAQFSK